LTWDFRYRGGGKGSELVTKGGLRIASGPCCVVGGYKENWPQKRPGRQEGKWKVKGGSLMGDQCCIKTRTKQPEKNTRGGGVRWRGGGVDLSVRGNLDENGRKGRLLDSIPYLKENELGTFGTKW